MYILNFFANRATNGSAESFNAKIKAFRTTSKVVRDIKFFLFRYQKYMPKQYPPNASA
nr:transposase [Pedobacter sp. Leaf176]